jgi:hypothetical protein
LSYETDDVPFFPEVVESDIDEDMASVLQTLSVKVDDTKSLDKTTEAGTDVKQSPTPEIDTRKVICKEKYLSVKASFKRIYYYVYMYGLHIF